MGRDKRLTFMDEKRLWWELDKIAVYESSPGGNEKKAAAAENMARYLKKPSHEECHRMWIEDGV